MAVHERFKTTIKEIADYYKLHIDEKKLCVDSNELHKRCWKCGKIRRLFRCHIVPSSSGGKDEPKNYVILCGECHKNAPNFKEPELFFDWLYNNQCNFHNTYNQFEVLKLYKSEYGTDMLDDIISAGEDTVCEILKSEISNSKRHLSENRINISTWVTMWRYSIMKAKEKRQ